MTENESQADTEVVFTGVIGEGLREPQQGDVLQIRGALVPPHVGPPGNLSDLGSFDGRLLAIETWAEGNCHIWGSAALIAPGLALTAKHVIDEFSEQGHFEGGTYALMAAGIRTSGIDMWTVRSIRMLETCDLAVLEMELTGDIGADHTFNLFEPCARLPEVGRALTMTGFVAGQIAYPIDPEHGVSAEAALGLSAGFVTALYPNGRTAFFCPIP